MANTIAKITTALQTFGRELLPEMKNALVMVGLLPKYDGVLVGNTLVIPDLDISGTASVRAIGGAATPSDLVATSRSLTVQHIYQGFTMDNFENLITNVPAMQRAARRIGYNVAAKCDALTCGLWNEWPYETGEVDGTAAFNSTDIANVLADAYKILMDNQAPMDTGCYCIVDTAEAAGIRKLSQLQKVSEAGTSDLIRNGVIGRLMNFNMRESQQVASATLSTAAQWGASPLVNNASCAIGDVTLPCDALGTGTIKAGSTFKVGNYQYCVTADATITTNAATLPIYPALKEAVADNAPLTKTDHSAAGSMNPAFVPDAFVTALAPPAPFAGGGVISETIVDDQTGIGIRLSHESQVQGTSGAAFLEKVTADVYFGVKTRRPEWIVKITGKV